MAPVPSFHHWPAALSQHALYSQITGGLSQYQLHKKLPPAYLSSFGSRFKNNGYAINPIETWWNAGTGDALTTQSTGLLTGQTTIDDVLKAMDVAWKRGPE